MEYLIIACLELNISLSSRKYWGKHVWSERLGLPVWGKEDKEICFILAWEHLYWLKYNNKNPFYHVSKNQAQIR